MGEAVRGAVALATIVGYSITSYDKLAAGKGWHRIPERVLLGVALLGGSPGVLGAMRLHRHKTRKPLFSHGVPLILVVQIALIWWIWRDAR